MRAALAKMLEKNPTQSSHTAFQAGGNGMPILTRASGQSTAGFQTMGLPTGSKPSPGGGANKTVLGAYRMGDQDGNGAAGAIYPNDIFSPPGLPDREYPIRIFGAVGNNVFQPEYDDRATIALLKRLGDQKFKAVTQEPFEEYLAQDRLARDVEEAARNASLSDLGTSREILRSIAAERRQQNTDDYLRKMLNAGASPAAANQELENIRNANAIQEAKNVDDRTYQAKTLIQRIAMSRGITPMSKEPLNQSQSIDNPQPSQAMSEAMGKPGQGFGTSDLDNRQLMTPGYYGRVLRRSSTTQEAQDEERAFSNLLSQGQVPLPERGSYSLPTMEAQEREQQMDMASEALAARLDTLRQRATRMKLPLPKPVVAKEILTVLYGAKGKSEGDRVLFSPETIQDMNPLQLLLAINWSVQNEANGFNRLKSEVAKYTWGTAEKQSPTLLHDLKKVAYVLNKSNQDIRIPFSTSLVPFKLSSLVNTLNDIKAGSSPELRKEIEQGRMALQRELTSEEVPMASGKSLVPTPAPAPTAVEAAKAALPVAQEAKEKKTPLERLAEAKEVKAAQPEKLSRAEKKAAKLQKENAERAALVDRLTAKGLKPRANQSLAKLRQMMKELE